MSDKTPIIDLKGVKKAFGPKVVLDGVDMAVDQGRSLVIIGASGTGKSVLIKCILGLLEADSGTILVDGDEVTHLRGAARDRVMHRFGMLFQGAALFDSLPIWENVAFGLINARGMSRAEARDAALDNLKKVRLDTRVADLFPSEISGGMQKRVGLARAIATQPDVIFFDEPTTGLDPITADAINDLINECVDELGATTFSITHDMQSVRKIADEVAMIHQGKIIWRGPVETLDDSGNPFVDQFVHGRAKGPVTGDG